MVMALQEVLMKHVIFVSILVLLVQFQLITVNPVWMVDFNWLMVNAFARMDTMNRINNVGNVEINVNDVFTSLIIV